MNDTITTTGPDETRALAGQWLPRLPARAVLALHGELGSGKTCFVQGLAHALGIRQPVTSPTFIIINEYRGQRPLFHIDLYRLRTVDEALAMGIEDYLDAHGITAIEWPDRIAGILPKHTVHIRFAVGARPDERQIHVTGLPDHPD